MGLGGAPGSGDGRDIPQTKEVGTGVGIQTHTGAAGAPAVAVRGPGHR